MPRPRRWTVVVAALCGLLLLAGPAVAQEVSTTTSTSRSGLTTTSVEPSEGGGGDGLSTGNKVVFLIAGLVVLALVLIVFTWRYWRATKPARASAAAGRATPPV